VQLTKLLLQNFRSYDQRLFEFDARINLIIGHNGAGKTNILESIYLLSSGKSFRSSSLPKLIKWDTNFTSIRAKMVKHHEESEIEVQLIQDLSGLSRTIKRKFVINKIEKIRKNYIGHIKTVVFNPEDIRLVTGSPSRRREFLDSIFSQMEWRYATALAQYNKALKHRNELLDQIRAGTNSKSELFYWDQSLIKNSKIIHDFRLSFINSANDFFQNHPNPEIQTIFLNYHPSYLTAQKLESNYQLDLHRGHTQAGVHLDDFSFDNLIFKNDDKNLADWGSRGQQRLATLSLKLAEINYIEAISHDHPILLLDDIFSELDTEHQKLVVDLCQHYQSFFTSSNPETSQFLPTALITNI
jgi:DNA replication and repair protein RecF